MTDVLAPHEVIDDFLPPTIAARLLNEIIAGATLFTASLVRGPASGVGVPEIRSSRRLPGRAGVDLAPFRAAIAERASELSMAVGVKPFSVDHTECSIVAHGDGDYYRTHIDTRTGASHKHQANFRVISCVYYLNREPKGFFGGDLCIHTPGSHQGGTTSVAIEAKHNRLVVFPAFIPHEVRDIICPSATFDDSRFSINCWLRRARDRTPDS